MSKRPIDKTKKSNIKCEHCMFFIQDKNANMVCNNNECTNADSPKYGKSGLNYWNRCKRFEWAESEDDGMDKKFEPFLAHSEITDFIYIIDKNDKYEVTEQCIKAMKATNRIPRWIPVSERLPEDKQAVLVCCPQYKNIYCAYLEKEQWWIFGAFVQIVPNEVVAWMPLPTPYDPQESEDME